MKVALVYDRVNKFGGAERVLTSLKKIFPDAPLYTLVWNEKESSWANIFDVHPTFINKVTFLTSKHELLAPIAPMAFETHNFDGFDLVISITSGDAKAVITKPNTLHICYCLTPTRYFWSGEEQYNQDIKLRLLPKVIKKYLRTVDLLTSKRPDEYISISNEIKRRVKKFYDRNSEVVYPAIDDKFYSKETPEKKESRKYYLIVSRLVPYKKIDLAIKAFNYLQKRLIIIGTGSEKNRLKKIADGNIEFVGSVNDEELVKYYRKAKAVIFPQEEDFGLVPIEAQACGTPVIAYGKGGALETVVNEKTGIFFENQTIESLIDAVKKFEEMGIIYQNCIDQSKKFSENSFLVNFSEIIDQKYKAHLKKG